MSDTFDVTGDGRSHGIERAVAALRAGDLVVLPTDTRYGLAVDAFSINGTERLRTVAQRSAPLPVMIRSPRQLAGLVSAVPPTAERLMAAEWPGPLTLVLDAEPSLRWDLGPNDGAVAVRVPRDEVAIAVIREIGPLAVTGAVRPGNAPASTVEQARETFGDAVAVYLDDGPRGRLEVSTIVDLTRREPHVLRPGAIDADTVLAVAGGQREPTDPADTPDATDPADTADATDPADTPDAADPSDAPQEP